MSEQSKNQDAELDKMNRLLRETKLPLAEAFSLVRRFKSVELIKDAIGSVEKALTPEEKGNSEVWCECVWAAADQTERMERVYRRGVYRD